MQLAKNVAIGHGLIGGVGATPRRIARGDGGEAVRCVVQPRLRMSPTSSSAS
jgi:hypothetical protein